MTATAVEWIDVGAIEEVPLQGARTVRTPAGDIAVFRTASGALYALADRCPHKGGPLSQGIVHGDHVTCPLHGQVIALKTGRPDGGLTGCVPSVLVRVVDGRIRLEARSLHALAP